MKWIQMDLIRLQQRQCRYLRISLQKMNVKKMASIFKANSTNNVMTIQQLTDITHILGFKYRAEDEVTPTQVMQFLDIMGTINFEKFLHYIYIINRADMRDLCSVLFYVSDSDRVGEIDSTDLQLILKYLNIVASDEDIYQLMDGKKYINYNDYMTIINQLRNEFTNEVKQIAKRQIMEE
ncbi:EF_hand domain-containing protein [Hexamita inflata]|uniref:EF hand domain-containing protein n=1 Tax=Hexamita inflata TaxID=28002 RepID=A0AA86UW40_9EUKA|nr:EF hand domain-containing protein [Hexamita inflata]